LYATSCNDFQTDYEQLMSRMLSIRCICFDCYCEINSIKVLPIYLVQTNFKYPHVLIEKLFESEDKIQMLKYRANTYLHTTGGKDTKRYINR